MSIFQTLFSKMTASPKDFTSFWSVIGVQDGFVFCHDPFTITAIVDFPMAYMKQPEAWLEEMGLIISAFTSAPPNTVLNTYLMKYFEYPAIDAHGISKWPILNFLEVKNNEKLRSEPSPKYDTFLAITIPVEVRSKRANTPITRWIDIKKYELGLEKDIRKSPLNETLEDPKYHTAFKEAINNLSSLCAQIKTRFNGQAFVLNTEQVNEFLSRLLNHTANRPVSSLQSIFSSDVFANPDEGILEYGGLFHATISARTKDLPKDINEDFNWLYYDHALADVPFNIQCGIRFPAYDKALDEAAKIVARADAGAAIPLFRKKLEAVKARMELAMAAVYDNNGRIVDVTYTVTTWSKTKEGVEANINALRNCLRGRNMGTSRDTYNLKAAWNCQCPWLSHLNAINTRLPSMCAEAMIPMLYPATYFNAKPPQYPNWYHTKYDQITCFDSFDTNCNNWNGVVVGASGTGKSFSLNKIAIDATTHNSKLFVIDKGGPGAGSFRNLIFNLKGTYIEINFKGETEFALNPFDGSLFFSVVNTGRFDMDGEEITEYIPSLTGAPDPDRVMFLTNIITLMIQNFEDADKSLEKYEDALIQELLEQAFRETNNNENNVLTITKFAEEYILKYHENPRKFGVLTEDRVAETLGRFYSQLDKFIGNGIYAKFFSHTKDLSAQDIFCFDMEGVDSHLDLKTILTSVIVQYCTNLAMDGDPSRKKLIVIDEAWALLGGGKMTSLIEMIWRTIRKHGGRIYCATQDFETIMRSPAGLAIMGNSSYFYFMGAKFHWDTVKQIEASGKNGVNSLTPWDYEGIRNHRFEKGKFAEFYLLTPTFKGTLRLKPSKWSYELSTTDSADKARQNVVKKKHGVEFITEAVLAELVGE
jgi:hypothetical protein